MDKFSFFPTNKEADFGASLLSSHIGHVFLLLMSFLYSCICLFQAEGAIFQKIQEQGFAGHPNQTIQLRTEIKIPPEAVGRIIGRRGAKVINKSSLLFNHC